jgi:tetraacyldisaccharide 4'-kinase
LKYLSKIWLLPFAGIYALIILIRNFAYEKGWLKSTRFDLPVICIGNLTTGGTGKTPHTEYLIELLKNEYSVGTLSRGYRRNTSGFLEVHTNSHARQVGDEPLLFKWKNPDIKVAVCEERVIGIPAMAMLQNPPEIILLDDAFQHRAVKPGISVLLTEYNNLFTDDHLLPMGRLREFKSGYLRADLIIVTKSPENLTAEEKNKIIAKISPQSYQYVFFSHYLYHPVYRIFENNDTLVHETRTEVLMVSGIANPSGMFDYLQSRYKAVYHRNFADHHHFESKDIESIITSFQNIAAESKILITTEKDATRLAPFAEEFKKHQIPVFCLPIKVNFQPEERERFHKAIFLYLKHTLPKEENDEHNRTNQ